MSVILRDQGGHLNHLKLKLESGMSNCILNFIPVCQNYICSHLLQTIFIINITLACSVGFYLLIETCLKTYINGPVMNIS